MAINRNKIINGVDEDHSLLADMIGTLQIPDLIRRRSFSDSAKCRQCRNSENVPEITIEDCSEQRNLPTDDDDFFNLPARPRARTCPEDMFRQPKSRPPTPPPEVDKQFKPISKHRSRERLVFAHHKLERVAEDSRELKPDSAKSIKKSSHKLSGKDKQKMHSPNKEISLLSKNKRTLISRPFGFTECG